MSNHWKFPTDKNAIVPGWLYYVQVCGFTFRFNSLEQVEEYLNYYRQKIHPSSADGAGREIRIYSKTKHGEQAWMLSPNAHDERQSRFDELPLYLREEPKRLKVVKALERALKQWRAETDKT